MIKVTGVAATMAGLAAHVEAMVARAAVALTHSAHDLESRARQNLAGHRYTERLSSQIEVTGPRPTKTGVHVTVGVDKARAPEAAPMEFGWHSTRGLQPPVEAISAWLGAQSLDPNAAFVVAREIGRDGYDFGGLHWLGRAAEESETQVAVDVAAGFFYG